MFAGTLSSRGLKTQAEMLERGIGRNSASLSHEAQHVQEQNSEPQVGESWRRGEIECVKTTQEDMKDDNFLLRCSSWNLSRING